MRKIMSFGRTERSKPPQPLHNFTLPCGLRWGNQLSLRCMKVNSNAAADDDDFPSNRRFSAAAADNDFSDHQNHHQNRRTAREKEKGKDSSSGFLPKKVFGRSSAAPESDDGDGGIAAMREKVMLDLQTAADKMKDAILKDGLEEREVSVSVSPPPPWKLRTRRAAASRTPVKNGCGSGFEVDLPKPNSGFAAVDKWPRVRIGGNGGGTGVAGSDENQKRPKFSVSLSKKEIEEDFMAFVGHRPPRRPKKRARNVQKQLDTLFPGLWLTEVTTDMYKVSDPAP